MRRFSFWRCVALTVSVVVLVAGCGGGSSTTSTLTGSVRSATSTPLPSLAVRCGPAQTAVEPDGSFVLTGVPTGQRLVEVLDGGGTTVAAVSVNVVHDTALLPIDVFASGSASGIKGIVLRGPLYPVEKPGVPNYASVPGARLNLTTADGTSVLQSIVADDQGTFSLDVGAGSYELVPVIPNAGLFPRGEPVPVKVVPGRYTDVQVIYDTGIR